MKDFEGKEFVQQSPAVKIEKDENKTQLEVEEKKIDDHFSDIKDDQFILMPGEYNLLRHSVYIDRSTGEKKEFNSGLNKEKFLEDVELACRHAYVVGAEAIIFMDKSARSFGLLAQRILPIIRLEYARFQGKDLSEIPLPKVMFLNPNSMADLDTHKHQPLPESNLFPTFKKAIEKFKTVLLFDEASTSNFVKTDKNGNRIIPGRQPLAEQYDSMEESVERKYNIGGSVISDANKLRKLFENKIDFHSHVGDSSGIGGNDPLRRDGHNSILKEWYEYAYEKRENNIASSEEPYLVLLNTMVAPEDTEEGIFVERNTAEDTGVIHDFIVKLGFKSLAEVRKQLRHEYDMIAKESWRRYQKRLVANSF